jgi:hypothetical protein
LAVEDGGFLAYEWIGEKNYLRERGQTRGANRTSLDALMVAEAEGQRLLLLIEWKYTEDYRGHKANECIAGSGFVEVNLDVPIGTYPRYMHFVGMHELGHVIGLAHPEGKPCYNSCYGPVMSYGSCPSEDRCVTVVATDDINGVNNKYHYKPSTSTGGGGSGGGGGTCRSGNGPLLGETNVASLPREDVTTAADSRTCSTGPEPATSCAT